MFALHTLFVISTSAGRRHLGFRRNARCVSDDGGRGEEVLEIQSERLRLEPVLRWIWS